MTKDPATGRYQLTQSEARQMGIGGQMGGMPGMGMPMGYPMMMPPMMMSPYGMMPYGMQPPQQQQGGGLSGIGQLGGQYLANKAFGGGGAATPGTAPASSGGGWLSNIFGSGGDSSSAAGVGAAGTGLGGATSGASAMSGGAAAMDSGMAQAITGEAAGTGLMGSTGATLGGSAAAGAMLPALGIGAGALVGGLQGKGVYDVFKGKQMGLGSQLALATMTGGASFLVNPLMRALGSRKGKEQLARDQVRKGMLDSGFLDKQYGVKLANGSTYNIGKDGGEPLYNFDPNKPGAQGALNDVNALGAILTGGNKKLNSDFSGYLTNAAMGGGDAHQNALGFYKNAGLDHDTAYGRIVDMVNKGQLDAATGDAYRNGLDQTFGVGAYANGRNPTASANTNSANTALQSANAALKPLPIPKGGQGKPAQAFQAVTGMLQGSPGMRPHGRYK